MHFAHSTASRTHLKTDLLYLTTIKMGKHDYAGTKLVDRESYDNWITDLNDDLEANGLMKYVKGLIKEPTLKTLIAKAPTTNNNNKRPVVADNRLDQDAYNKAMGEWMEKTASCRKRIWCQLNDVHKSLIKHLSSPKEIRDALIKRYTAPNKARLRLMLKQLFEVTN